MKYLSTHPETEERIKSVEALAQTKLQFEMDSRLVEGFERIQEQVRK
jgi:predicted Zn-dependent protease